MTRPFDSDLHALLAGGITAVLDVRNMAHALGREIVVVVHPLSTKAGDYRPEWKIVVRERAGQPFAERTFHLQLTEEKGAGA